MELREAEALYVNRIVRHQATGLVFKVYAISDDGPKEKRRLKAQFCLPSGEEPPFGWPIQADLRELDLHYRFIDVLS